MDYLKVVQMFAELAGSRGVFQAPRHRQPCITLSLEGMQATRRFHFVLDPTVARSVLADSQAFGQDRFLDTILHDCDPDRVHWIQFFVDHSPEFLDDSPHQTMRRSLHGELDRYARGLAERTPADLKSWIALASQWPAEQRTSRELARHVLRYLFRAMLSARLEQPVDLDDQLIFSPDIFTPSLRIKVILCDLNERIDSFVERYLDDRRSDTALLLGLTSLLLMGSTPILAGLTALFNATADFLSGSSAYEDKAYIDYSMVPTSYVARLCREERLITGVSFLPGDRLYVFLYEFTGCPFRRANILPFGHGRHQCPGAPISKGIMRQTAQACRGLLAESQFPDLSASPLIIGRGSAFLPFQN